MYQLILQMKTPVSNLRKYPPMLFSIQHRLGLSEISKMMGFILEQPVFLFLGDEIVLDFRSDV